MWIYFSLQRLNDITFGRPVLGIYVTMYHGVVTETTESGVNHEAFDSLKCILTELLIYWFSDTAALRLMYLRNIYF